MPSMQAPGQAAPPDPADAAHPRVGRGDGLDRLGGAVGRIVVDENRFPGDPGQGEIKPPHQFGDIAPLLVGGHDNGKLGAAQSRGNLLSEVP